MEPEGAYQAEAGSSQYPGPFRLRPDLLRSRLIGLANVAACGFPLYFLFQICARQACSADHRLIAWLGWGHLR